MTAAHLGSFYSASPIVLWVEDAFTRAYLGKVWAEPADVAFFVANGSEQVTALVAAAERAGIGHVFGVVDRDFGNTNIDRWHDTRTRVFRLPRHEIENYLLDADAIHGCGLHNRNRSPDEIRNELARLAANQPAWLAYRRVRVKMRNALLDGFPPVPAVAEIPSLDEAERSIMSSDGFRALPARVAEWNGPGFVRERLDAAHADFSAACANGSWVESFSGKEILRPMRAFVYQPPIVAGDPDGDFAMAVGDCQNSNAAVPDDLGALLTALRNRVGLPA